MGTDTTIALSRWELFGEVPDLESLADCAKARDFHQGIADSFTRMLDECEHREHQTNSQIRTCERSPEEMHQDLPNDSR